MTPLERFGGVPWLEIEVFTTNDLLAAQKEQENETDLLIETGSCPVARQP